MSDSNYELWEYTYHQYIQEMELIVKNILKDLNPNLTLSDFSQFIFNASSKYRSEYVIQRDEDDN